MLGMRSFRFAAAWTLHAEFGDWLKEWNGDTRLPASLKELAMKLKAWNAETFGNIFRHNKRNELRWGGGGSNEQWQ